MSATPVQRDRIVVRWIETASRGRSATGQTGEQGTGNSEGCRSHFVQPVVMRGRRELVSREPGTGKDEWGRERVSGQPGTGGINGAWFMTGRRNDEGQRCCTTVVVMGRRCDATDGEVLEGHPGPTYRANFSIPSSRFPVHQFPSKGTRAKWCLRPILKRTPSFVPCCGGFGTGGPVALRNTVVGLWRLGAASDGAREGSRPSGSALLQPHANEFRGCQTDRPGS